MKAPLRFLPPNPSKAQILEAKRNRLIMILLWETWARLNELLAVNVLDIDLENRTIHLRETKRKVLRGESVQVARVTSFSEETKLKIIEYLDGRKKGPLFISKKGNRLASRTVREMVQDYAEKAEIQRVTGYAKDKSPRFLISPKAFREAGEAYAIDGGMDPGKAAERAGHTVKIQQRNYDKYQNVRARDMVDRALPKIEV